jgi:hypothetical protein
MGRGSWVGKDGAPGRKEGRVISVKFLGRARCDKLIMNLCSFLKHEFGTSRVMRDAFNVFLGSFFNNWSQ